MILTVSALLAVLILDAVVFNIIKNEFKQIKAHVQVNGHDKYSYRSKTALIVGSVLVVLLTILLVILILVI